ncbi:MAG: caa(3)-type oxidase subunit IV [Deltaproteobacteria bacterium]|nr:MAG: caa(3)-type oxidase subunit IV [Deltaproteobacteria bacterium]
MSEERIPVQLYFRVFGILILLTLVTVVVAFIDLGPLNTVVALAIAVTKACFVILYFMHVRYSERLIPVFVSAGAFWLLILLVLTFGDYATRESELSRDLPLTAVQVEAGTLLE